MKNESQYDVIILGAGMMGTLLGAILAHNGVRTLLVEQGVHPRFAIGESTVPETTFQFRVLAARYGIPELAHLSTFDHVRRKVTTTCGVKRNFSFVFHRPGEPQRPHEMAQLPTLSPPLGPDVHFFRQDIDSWLLSVAASHGCAVQQRTEVTEIRFDADAVRLRTRAGATLECQYIVDAGGVKAPVAHTLKLREEPTTLRTHSRSLFTHMHGVLPFDACIPPRAEHGLPSPLSQGTLHHLFDGGWMWVIPFFNHRSSTNQLCSVGLNFDPRRHPRTGVAPEQEFRAFIAQYPALEKQFANAVAIREWTATDRTQFSSTGLVGDRYCLMPHAFAFVDPLFSSGLGISLAAVNMLGWRLIRAKQDGDYSAERFAAVEQRVKGDFAYVDRLVSRSYLAFSDFELWNAWYKAWCIGGVLGSTGVLEVLGEYARTGSPSAFELCEQAPYNGLQARQLPEYMQLFDASCLEMDALEAGRQSRAETITRLYDVAERSGMWPKPWGKDGVRGRSPGVFTIPDVVPTVAWVKTRAPKALREHYFKRFQLQHILKLAVEEWTSDLAHAGGSIGTLTRDFAVGYNRDWTRLKSTR